MNFDEIDVLIDGMAPVVTDLVKREIASAIAAVPQPIPGKEGAPGKDGADGKDGAAGRDGAPGVNGQDGAPGRDGTQGIAGKDGAAGTNGTSVTLDDVRPVLELELSKWALDFERRAADVMQRAIDRMPKPKDGVDGLGVDDLDITHDGDGNVTFAFKRGELSKQFTIRLPRFKDCGVYRDGVDHREGDGVTWGGSLWLATKDGQLTKPGTPDSGWRLAVKAGRDGKSADAEPAPRLPVKLR